MTKTPFDLLKTAAVLFILFFPMNELGAQPSLRKASDDCSDLLLIRKTDRMKKQSPDSDADAAGRLMKLISKQCWLEPEVVKTERPGFDDCDQRFTGRMIHFDFESDGSYRTYMDHPNQDKTGPCHLPLPPKRGSWTVEMSYSGQFFIRFDGRSKIPLFYCETGANMGTMLVGNGNPYHKDNRKFIRSNLPKDIELRSNSWQKVLAEEHVAN